MPDLLVPAKGLLLLYLRLNLVILQLPQPGRVLAGEPASSQPLDVQGSLIAPLLPHLRIEVESGSHCLVCPVIDEESFLLHLGAYFSLHSGGLRYPLIGLRFAGVAEFMGGLLLVSLGKGVPALEVVADVLVAADERLLLVDADDLDQFSPLVGNVALVVPFHHCRFHVVVVVYAVCHLQVVPQDHIA